VLLCFLLLMLPQTLTFFAQSTAINIVFWHEEFDFSTINKGYETTAICFGLFE
jgi:hypothetical protein